MSKKKQKVSLPDLLPDLDLLEQDLDEWLDEEPTAFAAAEFLHGLNGFVESAIELTKIIVDVERTQTQKLDRAAILKIFEETMQSINKGISQIAPMT